METITPEQKQPVLKGLALAGLLAVIIFIAWLSIQIVQVFPTALTSLANLANSVYNYNPLQTRSLALTPGEILVNAGEPFTVAWEAMSASGTYVFSYDCIEAPNVTITAGEKEFSNAACATPYDIGSENSVSVMISDTKERYTDISYTVSFFRPNGTAPAATKTATTTIINQAVLMPEEEPTTTDVVVVPVKPEVPQNVVVATTTAEVTATAPKASTTTATRPTKPATKTPVTIATPTYIYKIPVSDPKGQSDLVVSYLGIGTQNKTGTFNNTGVIERNTVGAIQFAVHNIGSKTSESWSYTVALPNGSTYKSSDEKPLLPNERAVLTIQFPALTEGIRASYGATVFTRADSNQNNNAFTMTALIAQ